MTQEEKANAYDEALGKARRYYDEYKTRDNILYVEDMEDMFPELKESEDERIREDIIRCLKYSGIKPDRPINPHVRTTIKDALAWLEKQGEQKPTDKVEPKFHEGDWVVVSTTKGDRIVQIASVEYFKDGHPSYVTTEGRWFDNGTKARLLTDKDVETIPITENKFVVK